MLQTDLTMYASSAVHDAQKLAQAKSFNSFNFGDILTNLNYAWRDIYQSIALVDSGFYETTVPLHTRITHLPVHVKNSVKVFAAQRPDGFDSIPYRASGETDQNSPNTYQIRGFQLLCPDAPRRRVWLRYVPVQQQLFFTHRNMDPQIVTDPELRTVATSPEHGLYLLEQSGGRILLRNRNVASGIVEDITDAVDRSEGEWDIVYLSSSFPYIFVTYRHRHTGEHESGFYKDILRLGGWNRYNPFDFDGRGSNVEYLRTAWNDHTGMGVTIRDWNDLDEGGEPRVKYLGWTPDTMLDYPTPDAYRLLVARLAEKFSAISESNVMGVQEELEKAERALAHFLKKDKSSFQRITNVNPMDMWDTL